ncbi:MAG: ABC transporter permease [Acidobacteria bacterium]|nr:ABC transporter permease [Acidobacteriota bacterium]
MKWPWTKQETELDREISFHLDRMTAEYMEAGVSEKEARRRARIDFGGPEQIKDECRDVSRWRWLNDLGQDLRFGARMMRKAPVVTWAAAISLALGIGANTSIFSLMELVLWRSLPVPRPEELVLVNWQARSFPQGLAKGAAGSMFPGGEGDDIGDFFSLDAVRKLQAEASGKALLASYNFTERVSCSYDGRSSVADERPVDDKFFQVLAINAAVGRVFLPGDNTPQAPLTVVVTHRYWRDHLGSDPQAVGRRLRINNRLHEILGVLPEDFTGIALGDPADLYVPIRQGVWISSVTGINPMTDPQFWWIQMIGRRAPGTSAAHLQTFLDSVFRTTWTGTPKNPNLNLRMRLDDGARGLGALRREYQNPLLVLLALVGLLLLIACANIANLLLSRATARAKEVALRMSLGCSRGRLMRQFLTESALLAGLGGLLSLAVASATTSLLVTLVPTNEFSRMPEMGLDWRLILATLAASFMAMLLFGLFPAWRASRMDASPALKEGSGSLGAAARSWWTAGKVLVVCQVALAVLLVSAATLFARNLQGITQQDMGFERTRVLLFDIAPGESGYSGPRLAAFYRSLEAQLRATPGVVSAGLAGIRPMNIGGEWEALHPVAGGEKYQTGVNRLSPSLIPTMGIRLLAGRMFVEADQQPKSTVALISEDLAQKFGGIDRALGARFYLGDEAEGTLFEAIGVVASAHQTHLKDRPLMVYLPLNPARTAVTVIVRTAAPPAGILPSIREAVRQLDKDLPLIRPLTMEAQINEGLKRERMFAYLCGAFGVLALLLSAVGLYGVISYAVSRRRTEIGVRMALGATRVSVVTLVLRDGLALTALGLVLGTWGAVYATRFVQKDLLFQLKPLDPASVAASVILLGTCAFVAALLPAWRAAAGDPTVALRQE